MIPALIVSGSLLLRDYTLYKDVIVLKQASRPTVPHEGVYGLLIQNSLK